jgi:hypothetical protein
MSAAWGGVGSNLIDNDKWQANGLVDNDKWQTNGLIDHNLFHFSCSHEPQADTGKHVLAGSNPIFFMHWIWLNKVNQMNPTWSEVVRFVRAKCTVANYGHGRKFTGSMNFCCYFLFTHVFTDVCWALTPALHSLLGHSVDTNKYALTHWHTDTYAHIYTHIRTHTCTHPYTHTHTHEHTHSHTHSLSRLHPLQCACLQVRGRSGHWLTHSHHPRPAHHLQHLFGART